jgi:hypothetical protein
MFRLEEVVVGLAGPMLNAWHSAASNTRIAIGSFMIV